MDPQRRRAEIMTAAVTIFAAKGYHSSSVSDIIQAAGIARGTFYLYFKDGKKQIFAALLDDMIASINRAVNHVEIGSPEPIESQLRGNVERVIDLLLQNPDLTRIVIRGSMGLDSAFDEKMNEFYTQVTNKIERSLKAGINLGLIRPCDTRLSAYAVLGTFKEVLSSAALSHSQPDRNGVIETLWRFNLPALLRPDLIALTGEPAFPQG